MGSGLSPIALVLVVAVAGCSDDTAPAHDMTPLGDVTVDRAGLLPNGGSCSAATECRSKSCTSGKCVQGTEPANAACSYDEQCASQQCVARRCAGGGGLDLELAPDRSQGDGQTCGGAGAPCCPTEPKCVIGLSCDKKGKCVKFA